MGAPRQGLNPTTNSVGFTAKLVTVRSVSADGSMAVVVDRQNTQTSVSMLVQRSKGPLPAPGDTWLISQDLGMWTFAAFVGTSGSQFAGGGSEAGPDAGAGGQVTIAPEPPSFPGQGDVWLNSANGNQVSAWNGSAWIPAQFGAAALAPRSVTSAQMALATITSAQIAAEAGITAAQVAFTAAQIGGSRVFTGTAQPSGMEPGDLWFNQGNGNTVSVWTGEGWNALLFAAPAIQPGSLTSAQLAQEAGIVASQVAFTVTDIGGTSVSVSAEEPPGPAVGDLWYDSTDGYALKQWSGSGWVLYKFGTGAIAAGSVTAELIAANTISAAQLAAGIIYAGIINGTLVEAATFIGSVFEGTDFTIDSTGARFYNGTPGPGTLLSAISSSAGADAYSNSYPYGMMSNVFTVTDSSGNRWAFLIETVGPSTYLSLVTPSGGQFFVSQAGVISAGEPGSPATPEAWHTIPLDSGWSTDSGYAAPSYRLLPDGNLQLTGLADFGSVQTSNHNLNNGNPLPAAYRPLTIKLFRSFGGPGARAAVQINPSGVIEALGNATYPYEYCEIDAVLPLNL